MGKKIKEQVFTDEGYKSIDTDNEVFKYKIIEHQNRVRDDEGVVRRLDENIVVSYSSKRARKDAHDYDGYYAIQTSEKNLQPSEVIEAYHSLWKIEESFRIMKTTIEVRPIFHWTEKRIKGHFVVCFLSFLMMRTLEMLLKDEGLSVNKIREALNSLTVTKFSIKDEVVYLKNKPDVLANIIMRKLRMKPLANITNDKEFTL